MMKTVSSVKDGETNLVEIESLAFAGDLIY